MIETIKDSVARARALFIVYCVTCFSKTGEPHRLNASYKCTNCKTFQKHDMESTLKLRHLDWSFHFFKVFIPALYLHQCHERKEYVDIFQLKVDTKFDLEAIPKQIEEYKLPIVVSLLRYVKMLIVA